MKSRWRLSLWLLLASLPSAHASTEFICDQYLLQGSDIVPLDVSPRATYFDRWRLNPEVAFGAVLEELMARPWARRPTLILDTNPGPRWSSHNILIPDDDELFRGKTYRQLRADQRSALFHRFAARVAKRLREDGRPVIMVDHHFNTRLLFDASTTPLMVDLLRWMQAQRWDPDVNQLRVVFEEARILRDHSDPDILLANYALGLIRRPDLLSLWGDWIKQIALYNDHVYLDPTLSPRERNEVILGYHLLYAFEKWIPENRPGGFESAMALLTSGLSLVRYAVQQMGVTEVDPLARFFVEIKQGRVRVDSGLVPIVERMARHREEQRETWAQLAAMSSDGRSVSRAGRVLIAGDCGGWNSLARQTTGFKSGV